MPDLTREEVLESLARLSQTYVLENIEKLGSNEFTYEDLHDKGLSERQTKILTDKLLKEGKLTKRLARYKGRSRNILTWVGKFPKDFGSI